MASKSKKGKRKAKTKTVNPLAPTINRVQAPKANSWKSYFQANWKAMQDLGRKQDKEQGRTPPKPELKRGKDGRFLPADGKPKGTKNNTEAKGAKNASKAAE